MQYLFREVFVEQSGHTVGAEDGMYGRPVSRVGFKHVFNQVVELI